MIIPSTRRASCEAALLAALAGVVAAVHYNRLGLTLSHYDARGHLIVARRVIDSLTPGWQQIGAVWLPLPHLLNLIPVQNDFLYRTGASGVAISIASFAVAAGAIGWLVARFTGSLAAARAAAVVFVLNPNLLYLQATPMTEPLLVAFMGLSVACLVAWVDGEASTRAAGWVLALACLTRYEAWPVVWSAMAATAWALWWRERQLGVVARRMAPLVAFPALTILAFLAFSRVVVGQWFVSSGFFVPENKALGMPVVAAAEVWYGTHLLSGNGILVVAAAGLAVMIWRGLFDESRRSTVVGVALATSAALPWSAFVNGHPFRIRYMVPLVAVEAVGCGVAASLAGRFRPLAAVALVALAAFELHPLDLRAPMVVEAQWDRPNSPVRAEVTRYLRPRYDGTKVMASMGSLGHYMQETSHEGFALRDFLHEGNGDIWLAALEGPYRFAGWILIEEKANGGDMLARVVRENPRWLAGYERVAEGAGVALYRRTPGGPSAPAANAVPPSFARAAR